MRRPLLYFLSFVALLFLLPPLVNAAEVPRYAGTIEAELDGQALYFPALKTDYEVSIEGDLASVTVVQTFENPASEPLHARYLFPLNHDAAVYAMEMRVGSERIRAQIHEKEEAAKVFAKAKGEGRAASLLSQQRPNMYTQSIANLMPGLPIEVRISYVQSVPKIDGEYELVVPLIVGPRFDPPGPAPAPVSASEAPAEQITSASGSGSGSWELNAPVAYPPVPGITLPPAIEPKRVAMKIHLNGGLPIAKAESDTHALAIQANAANRWELGLAKDRVIDNRDFVLRYQLGGSGVQGGLLVDAGESGGTFSLLLEPPAAPAASEIIPREMVFLLDCSGSMYGLPLDASKAFMRRALQGLRTTDTFRIIRFSDSATEFASSPLPATADNIARGIAYTNALRGEGGTMMSTGIRQALSVAQAPGTERIVVFLTDGYIGNDFEILGLTQELIGDARLYSFGVGTGVNRFLLDELARAGHGFSRYLDPTGDVDKTVADLAQRLDAPVLTHIQIDWGTLAPSEVFPATLPDLFAGQSLRVQGRYTKPGDYRVAVHGQLRGRAATLLLPLHLPAQASGGEHAVTRLWARAAIAEAMYQMTLPPALFRERGETAPTYDGLKQRVTGLGLAHSLVTQWTSFVAVSEQVYNANPEAAREKDVPLPQVAGVSSRAYPSAPFAGAAGPEADGGLLALLSMLTLALLWRRRYPARLDLG